MDAPRPARWTPLANMAMRGASLAARFALSIWVARVLGYDALGAFGLIVGLAGAAPALLGMGIGYHVNREILRADRPAAYRLLRDRLAMSAACAACAVVAAGGAAAAAGLPPRMAWATAAAIVALEVIAFDLHVALLHLRRPIAANALLFVRSAGWVGPVMLLGWIDPRLATLEALLGGWLIALAASFALLAAVLRDAPFARLAATPVDWRGLVARARRAPLVWLNDVAEAGQVYLDRFLVAQILGLAAAGVYTLTFAVTHGVYVLIASAVTQLSVPRLVAARDAGGPWAGGPWAGVLAGEARRAALVGLPLIGCAGAAGLVVLPALGFDAFRAHAALFAPMLATALVRPFADLAKGALYSLHGDRALALVNLSGVALSAAAGVAGLRAFGLAGIGAAALASQIALIALRAAAIRRHLARGRGGRGGAAR